MKWWKKHLEHPDREAVSLAAVDEAQERLQQTLELEKRINEVTSSLQCEVIENGFSSRLRRVYGREFAQDWKEASQP